MNIDDLREIIQLVDESQVSEFEYEKEGVRVCIRKPAASVTAAEGSVVSPIRHQVSQAQTEQVISSLESVPAPSEDSATAAEGHYTIESPMVGTFYHAPNPDASPYVQVGDRVRADSVVCIVEAMKLMNEIPAEVDGEIAEILVENGQLVEYGQPLFLVKNV